MRSQERFYRTVRRCTAIGLTAGLLAAAGGTVLAASPTASSSASSSAPSVQSVAVSTATLPIASAGSAYTATLQATGGVGPYTWAPAGPLPSGLTLSAAGTLSGTPSAAGTTTFDVQVTAAGPTAVQGGPNALLPGLPGWLQTFVAALLPAPPAPNVAVAALTLTVDAAVQVTTTAALPDGQIGAPYIDLLSAAGGSGSQEFVWSVVYGSLPAGLSLSQTGLISGTPTKSQTSTFTADVADVSTPQYTTPESFSLTIQPALLQILTGQLPDGDQGVGYSATLQATGGTGPDTWAMSGAPSWLSLDPSTGALTGTPGSGDVGTAGFTVTVTDSGSTVAGAVPAQQTASIPLTITVHPVSTVTITTTSLPGGQKDQAYHAPSLAASGGTAPYTWSWNAPAALGLSLGGDGLITGTPLETGTFTVRVQATDSSLPPNTGSANLTLTIGNGVMYVKTSQLPDGTVGQSYSTTLAVSGGTGPYSWSLKSGSLPDGLNLGSGGTISGTPKADAVGTASFTVQVTDSSSPANTSTQALSLTIKATQVTLASATLPDAAVGDPYKTGSGGNVSLAGLVSGGAPPYTFGLAPCTTASCPTLPAGLVISGAGVISGTPGPGAQGTYTFTVQVADSSGGKAQQTYTITVVPPLSVTTGSLSGTKQGSSYSATLSAQGGITPYTWSISSGTLPGGLSLSTGGTISGTVSSSATVQTYTFTVVVTDKEGISASRSLSISVSKK